MRRTRALTAIGAVVAVVAAALTGAPVGGAAAVTLGSVSVQMRGNGHGHGMSQYGARGAALAGLNATQILAFYYPGAKLTTFSPSTIRVLISGTANTTTVLPTSDLHVTGVSGALVSTGVSQFRLVASGTGLALQKLIGSQWVATATPHLPSTAEFSRTSGVGIRVILADGTSTAYRGAVAGVRSGSGVITVNRVSLDGYAAGVTPRESPASWPATAVHAQAVAARTYGRYAVEHTSGGAYDICDTDSCQVYGGMTHYSSSGSVLWTEDLDALSGNSNMVLRYNNQTIFAQYSASNGGWTADGGQPYLVGKLDPYDTAASGDPYLNQARTVPTSSIAAYYGLDQLTSIAVTSRDGNGAWGGRVTGASVRGILAGAAKTVTVTGNSLAAAMGLPTTLFNLLSHLPVGHLDSIVHLSSSSTYTVRGWSFDPDHSDQSIRVHVYVDGTGYSVTANEPRPDVQRVYGTSFDQYGYAVPVTIAIGTHQVCAYGIDADDPSQHSVLGCSTVTVSNASLAIGHVDSVSASSDQGKYAVAGWVLDRDLPSASPYAQISMDGTPQRVLATAARPDVQRVFGTSYDRYGFAATVAVPDGYHQLCFGAIDLDTGQVNPLPCTWVTVRPTTTTGSALPIGHLDRVTAMGGGSFAVVGWAMDRDHPVASLKMQITVDGTAYDGGAVLPRPDVQRAFGTSYENYGFLITVPVPVGSHQVCASALDLDTSAMAQLGCATVTGG